MSLFAQVQEQIRSSYAHIHEDYEDHLLDYLLTHQNIVDFTISLDMDDGSTQELQAYRCQHLNVVGPYKGGIRFHPGVSEDEVKSLSAWMSFKTAVVGLPLGGGKGGIIVNPKELSANELQRLSRSYIQGVREHIGPHQDVPAPDVNTNGTIMAWMVDEYAKLTGQRQPGVITGKPLSIGGSEGRRTATSLGGLQVLSKYLQHTNDSIQDKTIVIQGAGNVGLNFGMLAALEGAKIIAISDSKGAIYNENGLDMIEIEKLKQSRNSVTDYTDAKQITDEALLELNCDILVPAALENQITADNADKLHTKTILELANGPTTADADLIINKKGIVLIPDILANAGGVTVSYFEQVQNNTNFYWSEAEVHQKLEKIMYTATDKVVTTAGEYSISLRDAAYIVALERLLQAMQDRGR